MPLPNFLCVGAQKSGTTTLHNILSQHPDIYLPQIKETKFFIENYEKGIGYYEKRYFKDWNGEKIVGEIDPDYLYFRHVPMKLYELIGRHLKFIIILRNPIERAYSHYLMSVKRGYESYPFEKALQLEKTRLHTNNIFNFYHYSYFSRGFYYKYIQNYLKIFPYGNFLFIIFETDFIENREDTIRRIFNFINAKNIKVNINIRSNPATIYRSKLIRDVIYFRKPKLRKFGKILIPSKNIRGRVLNFLDKVSQKEIKSKVLPYEIVVFLKEKYIKDVEKLSKLLNQDLVSIWF